MNIQEQQDLICHSEISQSQRKIYRSKILKHYEVMNIGQIVDFSNDEHPDVVIDCVKELIDEGYRLELASDYRMSKKFRKI